MPNTPRPGKASAKEPIYHDPDQQRREEGTQAAPQGEAEAEEQEHREGDQTQGAAAGEVKPAKKPKKKAAKKAGGKAGATEARENGGTDAAPATPGATPDLPNVPLSDLVFARYHGGEPTTEQQQSIEQLDWAIRVAAQIVLNASPPHSDAARFALHQLKVAQYAARDAISGRGK